MAGIFSHMLSGTNKSGCRRISFMPNDTSPERHDRVEQIGFEQGFDAGRRPATKLCRRDHALRADLAVFSKNKLYFQPAQRKKAP
jgi:hypothetical protein